MTRRLAALGPATMTLVTGLTLAAQTPPSGEARLYLSTFAGYRGGRALWTMNGQPLLVFVALGDSAVPNGPGQYDTIDLRRRLTPGFVVGAAGAYFPGPHLGLEGEIAFLGLGTESACTIRQYQPPATSDIDPELCASLQGQSVSTSAVSFSLGLVGRLSPGRSTYPYARVAAGVVARTRGTIAMLGVYTNGNGTPVEADVLEDSSPHNTAAHVTVGAGLAFALGTGYQLRLEARDVVTELDRVTGLANPDNPATGSLAPPHGERWYHNLAFVVVLDVIFEKRRGRRY